MKNVRILIFISLITISLIFANKPNPIFQILFSNIKQSLKETLDETAEISEPCKQVLTSSYLNETHYEYYMRKMLRDSSKDKNDVGSFYDCYSNMILYDAKFSYFILDVFRERKTKTRSDYKEDFYIYGICIVSGCSSNELEKLIFTFNEKLDDMLHFKKSKEYYVYDTLNNNIPIDGKFFIDLIPLYIVLLLLLIMFFPEIPKYLFKCFFREKVSIYSKQPNSNELEDLSSSLNADEAIIEGSEKYPSSFRSTVNKKKLHKFTRIFRYNKNFEELYSPQSQTFNESGIGYVKGMQVISLFFFIFGTVYFILLNSPLKGYNETKFIRFLHSWYNCIVFFGIRYSPRIFFSVSGYTLVYKLYCYLDESKPVSYKEYFRFAFRQTYKYFHFLLFVVFFKYSFIPIVNTFSQTGPLWLYLKINIIDYLKFYEIFGYLYLYVSDHECHVFWISSNEVFFFIISSFILFLGYRHKIRTDFIFLALFFLFQIGRFVICSFILKRIYPSLYYIPEDYGKISTNPLFNYTYYLIGMFFGSSNYIFQKSINAKTIRQEGRGYLYLSLCFLNMFRKSRAGFIYFFTILGIIIILIFSNAMLIFYYMIEATESDHLQSFFENDALNIFLLIDIDIVVFIFHFICFLMIINGNAGFRSVFENKIYNLPYRLYFIIAICVYPITLYIFYQSETIISLEMFNIIFFTTVCSVMLLVVSLFISVFFEIPLKRLNKYILEK
jgi:hypothetical protein